MAVNRPDRPHHLGAGKPHARRARLAGTFALLALLFPAIAGAEQASANDAGWWISFQGGAGIPDGQVRVGEPSPSTPLSLKDDLGVDQVWSYALAVTGSAGAKNRLEFSAESIAMSGTSTFQETVNFDEGSFPPGSSPKTDPRFYLLQAEYRRIFGEPDDRTHWMLLAGLAYAYLDFRLGDQSEDFYRQEVPMPVIGAGWQWKPGNAGSFLATAKGFRYNNLNSGEKEGSTVYLDQDLLEIWAGWIGKGSQRFRWSAGYRYFAFSQTETSSEDYNDFHCHLNSITGSVAFRF